MAAFIAVTFIYWLLVTTGLGYIDSDGRSRRDRARDRCDDQRDEQ